MELVIGKVYRYAPEFGEHFDVVLNKIFTWKDRTPTYATERVKGYWHGMNSVICSEGELIEI